ncbi:MAG: sulfotransferase, partial [Candidatus Marithrix sp.]|nr:sulfotransferase [Candidatus Marithrix sp.]
MQIIVLGMHRSGTSMVARLLNMMGAYFAPDNIAMQPTVANPKGYWEREDIWHLNDAIFKKLGVSWDNISDFDVSKITEDIQAEFAPDIQKIIFSLDANRPWMIKDPRLCLLLDVWKPLLEVPVCVYVYRDPIQVAQSLTSRENSYATIKGSTLHNIHLADYSKNKANFPISLGMALWEKYTLNGLASSAGLPRVLISFHDLVANPIATANNLYKKLLAHEVQGLRLPSDKEILAYLDPKLCHADGDNKLQKNYVNSQQTKLIKSFQKGKIFKLNPLPNLSAGASEILEEYQNKLLSADKILVCQQDITQNNAQRDAEITQRDSNIENHLASITSLENHSKDLDVALQDSEHARVRYQQQAGNYKSQLLAAEQKINSLKQEHITNLALALKKQLEVSQTKLATKEQKISDYSQQIATLSSQLEHQEQNVHKLSHWILALNNDITAAFASLSWRSGRVFTRIALALMFKKAGTTAEDHIQEITEAIQNWKLSDTSERGISRNVVEKTPILTTLKKVAAQHVARDYQQWIKSYDTLTSKIVSKMQQQIEQWDSLPLISIVMPTYNTDEKWLRAAIDSVLQ